MSIKTKHLYSALTNVPITPSAKAAIEKLSEAGIEERGAIFTRREVVDFILDLVGYTPDKPLHQMRLLEPSFGNGDFLLPVVERLLNSYQQHSPLRLQADLKSAIRAVELHKQTFNATRERLASLLNPSIELAAIM
jgi:type I restriction-modification system DNA methylase subunit